ncbi:MAG: ABC transporter permease [Thermoproteota archaeon]
MLDTLRDIYSILWVDLRVLRRRWLRTLATSLVNPILYLVAFGFGLGTGVKFEGYSYLEFIIPGIIALTAMTVSFNGAGTKLNVDRLFFKSFDECLMSPINLYSIVVGKALIGVVRGLISSTAFLIVGFAVEPSLSITPLFITVLILSCFLFSFLGVLIAFLAKSHQDMSTFSSLILLPMTFLSGTFFSLDQIPYAFKVILYFLPLTHSSLCLRAAALDQSFPWLSLLVLSGFGLFFFSASLMALKKTSV